MTTKRALYLGVARPHDKGIAWIDYSDLEEEIVKIIVERRRMGSNPTEDELAIDVGKPPEDPDFGKALYAALRRPRNIPTEHPYY